MKMSVIPARQRTQTVENKNVKLRVAAYCHVSTDDEEQLTSYKAQVDHYTSHIQKNPDWEFAGVYADEAISGTNTKKRTDFHRLINDCMAGKIDYNGRVQVGVRDRSGMIIKIRSFTVFRHSGWAYFYCHL